MTEQIRIALVCAKERKEKSLYNRKEARKIKRQQNEFELAYQYRSQRFENSEQKTKKRRQQPAAESVISTDENYYQSNVQSLRNDASCFENDSNEDNDASEYHTTDIQEDFNMSTLYDDENLPDISDLISVPLTRLHHFTNVSAADYCRNLAQFLRDAKICKSLSNQLISIIKTVLPHPNYLPSSTDELYRLMNVNDLFTRRRICIACELELSCDENICQQCRSTDPKTSAMIFDVDLHKILSSLLRRLSKNIEEYKEKVLQGNAEQLNDIVFNRLYRQFVNQL